MWIGRMFNLTRNNTYNQKTLEESKEKFIKLLTSTADILYKNENIGQSNFILRLMSIINNGDFNSFVEEINSVDMWGGAGAVWEVYVENRELAKEFEKNMLDLIILMGETQIMRGRAKSLKELFEHNLGIE